jgi:hypothetical protein
MQYYIFLRSMPSADLVKLTEASVNKLRSVFEEVYGSTFLKTLDFYLSLESGGWDYLGLLSMVIERPRKAYEGLVKFFKTESAVRVLWETVLAKVAPDRAFELASRLLEVLRNDDRDGALRLLSEIPDPFLL